MWMFVWVLVSLWGLSVGVWVSGVGLTVSVTVGAGVGVPEVQ